MGPDEDLESRVEAEKVFVHPVFPEPSLEFSFASMKMYLKGVFYSAFLPFSARARERSYRESLISAYSGVLEEALSPVYRSDSREKLGCLRSRLGGLSAECGAYTKGVAYGTIISFLAWSGGAWYSMFEPGSLAAETLPYLACAWGASVASDFVNSALSARMDKPDPAGR